MYLSTYYITTSLLVVCSVGKVILKSNILYH